MICKSCGTECNASAFCTHCGAKLINEAFVPGNQVSSNSAFNQSAQQRPAGGVASDVSSSNMHSENKQAAARRRLKWDYVLRERLDEKIYISFESIFFPTLFLLLPLCYFFFDLFALYSPGTFSATGGGSAIFMLVSALFSGVIAGTSASSLIASTVGEGFVSTYTFKLIFEGESVPATLVTGAVVMLIIAVLCAAAAAALLFTWGRLLRQKIFADFVVSVSVLGALSPLVAYLAMRFVAMFAEGGADAAMQCVHFSIETALLFGISLCLMLRGAKKLRRVAGGVNVGVFAALPFRLASSNTFISRILAIACGSIGILLPFLALLAGGMSSEGENMPSAFAALGNIGKSVEGIGALFAGDAFAAMRAFAELFLAITLLFALLYTVIAIVSMARFIFLKKELLVAEKSARRFVDRLTGRFRGAAVAIVVTPMVLHVLLTLVALFLTNAFQYINAFDVQETLHLIYALIAYTGTFFELNSFGWTIALLSIVFATVGGNFARGIADRAGELGE